MGKQPGTNRKANVAKRHLGGSKGMFLAGTFVRLQPSEFAKTNAHLS